MERQAFSDSTYRNYEGFLRIHLLPQLEDRPLGGIEPLSRRRQSRRARRPRRR
ncbi:hypothetical protein [Streptomyces sp. RKAG290]|uniref:hypothetical protein n=1 Tax=Streptomyces sp. RKAG290 TaxID=2888348 RepID=UPI0035A870B6